MSFWSSRKISTSLVKAKLYPVEGMVGSKRFGKSRCEVCLNIEETDTFTSTTTCKSFKINQKLNCDNNCLIYPLTCCGKQYIAEPTDEFRLRWNNYKSNYRKNQQNEAKYGRTFIGAFWNEGHGGFLGYVSMTLIDEAKPMRHLDLILKTASDQSHAKVSLFLVGLPFWYFWGGFFVFVPGTNLGKEFLNMTFFVFIVSFISLLLIHCFM